MKKLFFIFIFNFLFAGFPNYYYKLSIKEQKKEFKKILLPMIREANDRILFERNKIIEIFNNPFAIFQKDELKFLIFEAKRYKIKDIFNKKEFLKKVDIIPENLVLAQGAIESAWGRSYFVKVANNLFGQWDYSGRGVIPRNRDENATHTIRIFRSLKDSLSVYMRNLNRNPAYKEFRELRYKYHQKGEKFTSLKAATTLHRYSELGDTYVKILQNLIKQFRKERE